jgi:hypothetical protein
MVALTNFEIEDICKQMQLPIVGVYSKDKLPEKRYIGSYYVNLEDHNAGGGSHWVFMRIFPNKKAIYMDSFGVLAPVEIKDFLKPFRPYATNNRHFQDNKSSMCGYFDIACDKFFEYDANKKKSVDENFDDFLNMFSINKLANDKIVMEYLKK